VTEFARLDRTATEKARGGHENMTSFLPPNRFRGKIPWNHRRVMRPGLLFVGVFLFSSNRAWPQGDPGVDQTRVDEAIAKGVEFLKTAAIPGIELRPDLLSEELVLWTFVHAGVPYDDPKFEALWKKVVSHPLERTYDVALLAMILEEVDRVRYQKRILHCAQFLADNQCKDGQWDYGAPTVAVPVDFNLKEIDLVAPKVVLDAKGHRVKPKVLKKIAVRKTRDGQDKNGCNSNSQYAALGLRACADAGIVIPKEVLTLAKKSWVETQHGEKDRPGAGWCYGLTPGCDASAHPPSAGMTAGGVGALLIYDHLMGLDWAKDNSVREGIAWLDKSFSFKESVASKMTCPPRRRSAQFMVFYALYALERIGRLARVEKIGSRVWYPEGVAILLEGQKKDGSWGPCDYSNPVLDTCFAILFLKRATRPLNDVASEDRYVAPNK